MIRIHKFIAEVTIAEKEEREKQRTIEKAVCGYDTKVWTETALKIRDADYDNIDFQKLKLSPPIKGKHKYTKWKMQYTDIHEFLTSRKWAQATSEGSASGVTWLELFILFDTTHARSIGGEHTKDEAAHKRAMKRTEGRNGNKGTNCKQVRQKSNRPLRKKLVDSKPLRGTSSNTMLRGR